MRIFLDTNVILENFLVREDFKDVEDGCQYELAMKAGCTLLLTFNSHDFPSDDIGSVKVMTPVTA